DDHGGVHGGLGGQLGLTEASGSADVLASWPGRRLGEQAREACRPARRELQFFIRRARPISPRRPIPSPIPSAFPVSRVAGLPPGFPSTSVSSRKGDSMNSLLPCARRVPASQCRPRLETLEDRRLLTCTVTEVGGVVTVLGDQRANVVQ